MVKAFVLVLVAAISVGCTGGTEPHPTVTTVSTPGLRGVHFDAAGCPRRGVEDPVVTEPPGALTAVSAASSLVLCHTPGSEQPDRIVRPGAAGFGALVGFLGRPDEHAHSDVRECLGYADGLVRFLAQTPTGTYWLEVPHDLCGHYQRAGLSRALIAAFGHD